ncbi:uncharacterized protein V1518DRAFT_405205 [Limtongia smithiae]|uniref:uncharacterized protein n=1 Tax=Limtongia smithiae TaxID=1125753 RepID=UPI0034CFCF9B
MFSTPQQSTPAPSLFSTVAKPTGGSLFGTPAPAANATPTTTAAPFSFGAATPTTSSATPFSFGTPKPAASATTPAAAATPFSFGTPAAVQSTQPVSSLFGAPAAAAPPATNLFSNTASTAQPAASAPFTFGASQAAKPMMQQQQQQQQQQPSQPVQITALTRHSDLPDAAQKELDAIDSYITQQVNIADDLKARRPKREETVQSVRRDVEVLWRKLATTNQAIANDLAASTSQRTAVDAAAQDVQLCEYLFRQLRIPGARLPPWDPLISLFERRVYELEAKIGDYKAVLADVERATDGLERQFVDTAQVGMGGNGTQQGSGVAATGSGVLRALKEEYAVFMALGNRVAELHHTVARLETRDK